MKKVRIAAETAEKQYELQKDLTTKVNELTLSESDLKAYTIAQDADAKREALGIELELMQEQAEGKQELLDQADEYKLLSLEKIAQAEADDLIREEQWRIKKATKDKGFLSDERKAALSNAQEMLGDTANYLKQLATIEGNAGKAAFMAYKATAMGEAIIAGILAVNKTWASIPYPWNIPAVAIVGAATLLNVGRIASEQPPSYDTGGITRGSGLIQVGTSSSTFEEAHVPLSSGGAIPVDMPSGGGNTYVFNFNADVYGDIDSLCENITEAVETRDVNLVATRLQGA